MNNLPIVPCIRLFLDSFVRLGVKLCPAIRIENVALSGEIHVERMVHFRFLNTWSDSVVNFAFRDTTLMPNIHGLLPLVSLIFAPFAELR